MSPAVALILYCTLILLASLAGGLIPTWIKLTHKRMELAVSFVAGVMLGVGLLHMLPHAFQMRMDAGLTDPDRYSPHGMGHALVNPIVLWLLGGFLTMFFIERFFCFHHHDAPGGAADHDHASHAHEHDDDCSGHHHPAPSRHRLTWTGAAIGLSVHSLIEGIALAASIEAGRTEPSGAGLAALGTFLVIFLHKPFDSLTIGTLMTIGRRSANTRHLINAAFSLLVPAGVLAFYLGMTGLTESSCLVSWALAFSAGTFLCIAMSDLLPELQFHQHDRGKLSVALLAGLALAWLIGAIEARMHESPGHDHSPDIGENHAH
jgi:zinc and cadmium transporter